MPRKYFDIFFREAGEHLQSMQHGILVLEGQPGNRQLIHELLRNAHTIKGSARMLGVEGVSSIAHEMEDFLKELDTGLRPVDRSSISRLLHGCDAIARINSALSRDEDHTFDLKEFMESFRSGEIMPSAQTPLWNEPAGGETVRVKTETLDSIVNIAEELIFSRQRLEESVATFKEKVKSFLSPSLHKELRNVEHDLEDGMQSLENLTQQVYSNSLSLRMLPFKSLVEGYQRSVRDIASSLGKEVTLKINGGDVEFDRGLLEELKPVLLHIVNNSVVHGIELPDERRSAGKPSIGVILFNVSNIGDQVKISICDDGRGVNTEVIKCKAVEAGILDQNAADSMKEEDLLQLVLHHGFSTSESLTDLAGRGVGLDVVNTTLQRIRGRLSLYSVPGRSFEVAFQLPLSLSLIKALLVSCSGDAYALPIPYVQEVVRVKTSWISNNDGIETILNNGDAVRLHLLAGLLGFKGVPVQVNKGRITVVILELMGERMACAVDASYGDFELVVRKLSGQIRQSSTFKGATILGDGNPALILDVYGLFEAADNIGRISKLESLNCQHENPSRGAILVVDDSITSRTIEQTILKANGYFVETADSGAAALIKLETGEYDLIISDLEMPGMDGYELIQNLRLRPFGKTLPVIVISSLSSDFSRSKAIEAGAQAYIVKGDFDQVILLSLVQELIGRSEESITDFYAKDNHILKRSYSGMRRKADGAA